jgi:hypothetical protein
MRCLSTKGGECISVFTFQCLALAKSALRVGTVSDPNKFSIFWSRNLFIFFDLELWRHCSESVS